MSRLRVALVVLVPTLLVLALWGCGGEVLVAPSDGGTTDASIASDATTSPADGGFVAVDAAVALDPCAALDGGTIDAPFAPSNFDPARLDASVVVDIDITAGASAQTGCLFDTTSLRLSCGGVPITTSVNVVAQPDAGELAVFTVGKFTIEPGAVVEARGDRALVIDARGAVDLGGELRASYPDSAPRPAGLVPLTLSPGDFSPLSVHCGRSPNSPLVAPWGSGALTPLAGSFYALVGAGGQTSGWGGGAIQVSSTSQLRVGTKGLVNVNGTGAGSYWPGAETGGPLPSSSGGAVLLEAPVVIIDGQVAANGSGGACYTLASGVVVSGGFGGTSPDTAPALGGDAGTAWGGAGSAGDDPNGQPASPGCDARYPAGGGGAGWIAVKTRRCSITGTVSPSLKSGCANVMPLAAP